MLALVLRAKFERTCLSFHIKLLITALLKVSKHSTNEILQRKLEFVLIAGIRRVSCDFP